jgi:predicted nucleotidyltransferase
MLVDDHTFDLMAATAVTANFDGMESRVVSLDNLLILKLHVLQQALPHRTGKDAGDVEELLRRNRVALESDHYRNLFLTYGDQNLYDTFRRLLRHR